jgi:endoribonuclease Dicer
VFLVPTVVLAIQQAAYLRKHTHLKVKEFYGGMGVDMWEKNRYILLYPLNMSSAQCLNILNSFRWETEFETNHVLVMTAQIFVDIINHAFFSPYLLNLLVFDECHAAVKDAPMKQVLTKLRSCDGKRKSIFNPVLLD